MNRTHRVDRGGFSLAVHESGRADGAPVIVLSNSLGASSFMWTLQMPLLRQHFRVLAYDTRGHGDSDAPEGPYTFDGLVADVIAIMDRFEVDTADYMGLSLGCMTGLGLAVDHPDRLRRVVACDGRADAPEGFVKSWDERIAAIEAGGMPAILDGTMARWFTEATRQRESELMKQMDTMFLGTRVTGYKGCAEALKKLDYLKDLGRISVPVLFVAGDQDAGAPPDVMRAMQAATPGARFAEIPDAAHLANVDNPDAFNRTIAGFLDL